MKVVTQDLYYGAYILSRGGHLEGTKITEGRGSRPLVSFIFTGSNVEQLSSEYQSGQASVQVASFKIAMEHLKDLVFEKMRQ